MYEEKQIIIDHGILDAIEKDSKITQSELARSLSISLGLCNAYLKRLVNKGYVKVLNFKLKNARYLLTPDGIALKLKLTRSYILRSLDYYKVLKNRCEEIIKDLKLEEVRTISIVGANEIAEIFYLHLQNTRIKIIGVYDDKNIGNKWFEYIIEDLVKVDYKTCEKIIITQGLAKVTKENNKEIIF